MSTGHSPDAEQASPGGRVRSMRSRLRHAAMPYRRPDELAESVAIFLREAAQAGEAALVAAAAANLDFLRARVDTRGSQVRWADISGPGRNPARLTGLIRKFADAHRGKPVRCVHEAAWPARTPEELRELYRHEALLNRALADAPARLLCPYDARLGPEVLAGAEQTHPAVVRHGRWRPSSSFTGTVPAECGLPLPDPPPSAEAMSYRDDLAAVRRFAAVRARRAGLPPDKADDLVIAVGELAANTLGHTTGPGTLTMWATGSEIICQVQDTGHITDPLAGTRPPAPAASSHGLWVVHQVADLAEIRTSPAGTTIRLHMRLN